jgi:tRNA-splicing ligase RtcB
MVGAHWAPLTGEWAGILARYPKLKGVQEIQLGTLGTGNHFIEICVDTGQTVWVMLHSGSRGVGNRIGTYCEPGSRAHTRFAMRFDWSAR